jgi:hypothetical protein
MKALVCSVRLVVGQRKSEQDNRYSERTAQHAGRWDCPA